MTKQIRRSAPPLFLLSGLIFLTVLVTILLVKIDANQLKGNFMWGDGDDNGTSPGQPSPEPSPYQQRTLKEGNCGTVQNYGVMTAKGFGTGNTSQEAKDAAKQKATDEINRPLSCERIFYDPFLDDPLPNFSEEGPTSPSADNQAITDDLKKLCSQQKTPFGELRYGLCKMSDGPICGETSPISQTTCEPPIRVTSGETDGPYSYTVSCFKACECRASCSQLVNFYEDPAEL